MASVLKVLGMGDGSGGMNGRARALGVKPRAERSRNPEGAGNARWLGRIYSKQVSNHQKSEACPFVLLALNDRRRIVAMQTGVKRAKPVTLVMELLLA